jgi:uncharacterized protein YqgC (DUF456 family)
MTAAAIAVVIASVAGVVLTLLTLPGIWLAVGVAAVVELLVPELLDVWTIGAAAAIGVVAELAELLVSAVGAKKAGGTRRGAIGSVIGALVGALGGSVVLPIIGTIMGAAVGAGLGALIAERHGGAMTWRQSAKVGGGAAVGRLVATVVKTALAAAVGIVLTIGVLR